MHVQQGRKTADWLKTGGGGVVNLVVCLETGCFAYTQVDSPNLRDVYKNCENGVDGSRNIVS